jgi:hypothetical protein
MDTFLIFMDAKGAWRYLASGPGFSLTPVFGGIWPESQEKVGSGRVWP